MSSRKETGQSSTIYSGYVLRNKVDLFYKKKNEWNFILVILLNLSGFQFLAIFLKNIILNFFF